MCLIRSYRKIFDQTIFSILQSKVVLYQKMHLKKILHLNELSQRAHIIFKNLGKYLKCDIRIYIKNDAHHSATEYIYLGLIQNQNLELKIS